ncbi:MAG: PASTA domain-containing protein [Clostridia bacterium]|nr:PASTA domain-containing protein [Clostridia bacterium]
MATKRRRRRKKQKNTPVMVLIALVIILIICVMVLIGMNLKSCEMPGFGTANIESTDVFEMPNVRNMTEVQMKNALEDLVEEGFQLSIEHAYSHNVDKGKVASQSPLPGEIKKGEKITVIISLGETEIKLPDYSNVKIEKAVKELETNGLVVKISEEENNEIEEGFVIRHLPSAGQTVKSGDEVRLFVSTGPEAFELDDYVGVRANDAKNELKAMGVKVTVYEEYSDAVAKGDIIAHEPSAGAEIKEGDEVILYVSLGAAMVTVPDITGLGESEAEEKLVANGLHLGDITEIESSLPVGTVIKQSIAQGTEVEMDTIVDIVISSGVEDTAVEIDDSKMSDSGL